MRSPFTRTLLQKVMVPVVWNCAQDSALAAAKAIGGEGNVLYRGIVAMSPELSLSMAAIPAREVRKQLRQLSGGDHVPRWAKVYVSYQPWLEVLKAVEHEKPDLLILEWPSQFEALRTTIDEVLAQPPCNILVVNSHFAHNPPRKILVPMRGGPYAELALRIALSLQRTLGSEITTLHTRPPEAKVEYDIAFQGIKNVLRNLPEIKQEEVITDTPAEVIQQFSQHFDLVVLGASARTTADSIAIGPVAAQIMKDSQQGVMVVKTQRTPFFGPHSEELGQAAISILVDKWFAENTFHAGEFDDLSYLLRLKQEQGVTISLALPALNEEETVGHVISTIKEALVTKVPLLDEIVLMDSNSSDRTREIARELGIPVYIHQEVLPQYGARPGKGEALWKSLYCTRGDLLIWIDTDIVNIHPRFVYGLIGPLLLRPDICFVKGYYKRPLKVGTKIQATGGGRVTELVARPLLNLFYPELSGVIQPLSGEYGGRRSVLERLPFFSGYGVEIGLLIDIFKEFGLSSIAQVDLQERIHHNQPLEALSKMSFAIIQAVIRKVEDRFGQNILESVNKSMKLIRNDQNHFWLEVEEIAEKERPPMISLPEYRQLWQ